MADVPSPIGREIIMRGLGRSTTGEKDGKRTHSLRVRAGGGWLAAGGWRLVAE